MRDERGSTRLGIVYHMPFWRDAEGTLREVEGSFARYIDSIAPYFGEIVLCVPVLTKANGEGTAVQSSNVTLAPLTAFDGPMRFYFQLPRLLPSLVRFARRVDMLHCRVPTPAAIFAFVLARLFGRPAFLLVVGDLKALSETVPYRGMKRWLWRAYAAFEERNIQWMADRALTFANGAPLAEKHSRPGTSVIETRTTTIRLADVATRENTCAGPRLRLLTVSRIDPRKGLTILPDVVKRLQARGFDVTLDVIGPVVGAPGERERRTIAARAAALGVEGHVRMPGPVPLDRLLPLYREYDLFVLPTLPGEGIPRVLLEAMTAGVPVVTTRVAGIPNLVTHEVNGLLVDEPTPDAVTEALARLLSDGGLRRHVIANGYQTARAHTLDAQAAEMMREVSSRLHITLRRPSVVPAT